MVCIGGAGWLTDGQGERLAVHQGETVLLPAVTRTLRLEPVAGTLKVLTAWV